MTLSCILSALEPEGNIEQGLLNSTKKEHTVGEVQDGASAGILDEVYRTWLVNDSNRPKVEEHNVQTPVST